MKAVLTLVALAAVPLLVAAPHERYTKHNGLRVRYTADGQGSPTMIFVHGWTCDSSFWRAQMAEFAKTNRVIAVDLPGHGGSAKPILPYSVDLFAGAVATVAKAEQVDSAIVFGHSMGVPVAMQFVQDHPELSLGFVAVDGAVWRYTRGSIARSPLLVRMHRNYHSTAGAWVESMFVENTPPELRTDIKKKMLATPRHVAVSALDELGQSAVWERCPNSIPTLAIVAGARDTESREQLHRELLPNIQYETWPEAGHFLMLEQPDRFNELVRTWAAKLPASPQGIGVVANQ